MARLVRGRARLKPLAETWLLVRALGWLRLRKLLVALGMGLIPFGIYYAFRGIWPAAAGGAVTSASLLALAGVVSRRCRLPSFEALNMALVGTNAGAVVAVAGLGAVGVAWIGPLVFINLLLGGAALGAVYTVAAVLLIVLLSGMHGAPDLIASIMGALVLSGAMALTIAVSLRDHLGRLQLEASEDALTGAVNRRGLARMLGSRLAALDDRHPFSLILLDLDRFKDLNDRLGHTAGDTVLRDFVHLLKDNLRRSDKVYRYGGEEFIVPVEGDQEHALRIAEKLLAAVARHAFLPDADVTVSAGVAQARPGDGEQSLIARADRAMYSAKAAGRNRCAQFEPRQDA